MNELLPYVQELEQQIHKQRLSCEQWKRWCEESLNSGPAHQLRQAAELYVQKAHGAFFTSPELADRAAQALGVSANEPHVYLDPTCGAGDLLLAVARRMKLESTVSATLALWGKHLIGCDISSAFVRTTRARVAMLAMIRSGIRESLTPRDLCELLPSITTANVLDCPAIFAQCDRIIMNPPFLPMKISGDCIWASGVTNSAARFAESAIANGNIGTRMVAILPDVVRSGARYHRWREMVNRYVTIDKIEPYGTFDKNTDVDVFLLRATVRNGPIRHSVKWTQISNSEDTVSVRFEIHVGAVVPHRDPQVGVERPYIDVGSLAPWSTKLRILETRRFSGRVFRPPFVAIRRTSSPSDRSRAVGTIVADTQDVAVENHLIVCLPYDHSIESCQELVARLRCSKTDHWLNGRIRCRHLTVGSVRELPWWRYP